MADSSRPLHVLVLVGGERLAHVLESALSHACRQQRLPDEIHVMAPPPHLDRFRRELLRDGEQTRFATLCGRLGVRRDEILLNQRTLHAFELPRNGLLSEAAERVFELLRHISHGRRSEVTVLVTTDAGALGVLAHAAMQVVARPFDRFFVATGTGTRGRNSRKTTPPRVECAEVPLLLSEADAMTVNHYMDAVAARRTERQRLEQPDPLRLDLRGRTVTIGRTEIRLPAMQFFWLYYLATSAGERFPLSEISSALTSPRTSLPIFVQKLAGGHTRAFPAHLLRAFMRVFPHGTDKFAAMFQRSCGPQPGLPSTISKINAVLRRALGRGAEPYLIKGGRGAGGYRVTLSNTSIHIVE
jgi:hypothetical protein